MSRMCGRANLRSIRDIIAESWWKLQVGAQIQPFLMYPLMALAAAAEIKALLGIEDTIGLVVVIVSLMIFGLWLAGHLMADHLGIVQARVRAQNRRDPVHTEMLNRLRDMDKRLERIEGNQ